MMVYKCLSITLLFVTSLTVASSLDGSQELEVAVSLNDLKTVERLLHPNTINLIVQEREWKTACIAAEKGNLNILEYIVNRNSSILQRKNKNNCTLAHIAAQYDQLGVVAYCLAKLDTKKCTIYEDVIRTVIGRNAKGDSKTSELILKVATTWKDAPSCLSIIELAREQNDTRLIQYIAEEKTSLFLSYPNKVKSLLKIAIEKNVVSQKFLEGLEANHALMKSHYHIDYSEYTICHLAAECDRLDIIQFIANRRESSSLPKANCNIKTVFSIAVEKGFVDIIRYVIGENPSMAVKKDWKTDLHWLKDRTTSAFHYAMKKNFIDMDTLKYLVEEKKVPLTLTDALDNETIAHTAAYDGKIEILLYLVEKEPSLLTIQDYYCGRTVLDILARNYNLSMDTSRFIIQKLANSTERDKLCRNIGFIAADHGNIFFLMCIVELEPSIIIVRRFETGYRDQDPILCMLANKNMLSVENVGFFIDKGGSLLMKCVSGDTVVGIEAKEGNIEILKYLVERESSSLTKNSSVLTEISEAAARYGHLSVLKLVAEKEPAVLAEKPGIIFKLPNASDVLNTLEYLKATCEKTKIRNLDSRRFRSRVLKNVIEYNYLDILKYMNYDVNMISKKGEPLIFTVIRRKRPDIFYYLATDGNADLTALDSEGNNILFIAARNRDLEKMKYILDTLKVPLEIEWRNNMGDTLLHVAVHEALTQADRAYNNLQKKRVSKKEQSEEYADNGYAEGTESSESSEEKMPDGHRDDLSVIEYLVEQKHADINARGHQNKTVLHWAASGGNHHLSNYLLDHGADPKFRDQSEQNFWQAARFPTLPSSRNTQQNIPVE